MQFSDYLTIILSLVGVIAGAAISWLFFKTQLITDFTSLKEKLIELNVPRDVNAVVNPQLEEIRKKLEVMSLKVENSKPQIPFNSVVIDKKMDRIHADIKNIQSMMDLIEHLDSSKEISAIKNTVEKLDKDLNSAVREILSNVKAQQLELAKKIKSTYESQAITATNVVRDAFSSEVRKFVKDSVDREKLLTSLVDSFMEGMRVMGDYQKTNIETQTTKSINDIEEKIISSIDKVVDEVGSLKNQIIAIPSPKQLG